MVVQHCKAKDIKDIVISPGSRNAPLTISFTEDPFFNCFSVVDERCAAFFALGMAQQLKHPIVVLCTSGSALLNYYPAVAEAFYSGIPLMVISADRPFYKIDVGDGQTIRQDHVFDRHIGYSANLKQDATHATDKIEKYAPEYIDDDLIKVQQGIQEHNNLELNKAMNLALQQKLPVHINVPFEEPLYNVVADLKVRIASTVPHKEEVPELIDESFLTHWNSAKRKMILVGVNNPNTVEQDFLNLLANDPSVLVMTETTSNLHHKNFFPSIDSIIAPIEKSEHKEELFKALQPDILITFGGLVVSKKIKAFLREYKPEHHWHIDAHSDSNTFFALTHHFKLSVNDFFSQFLKLTQNVESNYFQFWNSFKKKYEAQRTEYLKNIPFSDLAVFKQVLENIPSNVQLQLANSSTIRYAQLFDLNPSAEVFCNRGTSGIDGSVSTAVGAAVVNGKQTVLITGDLSFLYDSNGLWNTNLKSDFRIILINNDGGGIFRILPGQEETPNFETYFETTHALSASHLCKMYELGYSEVNEMNEFKKELKTFYSPSNRPKLLEIKTPRLLNNKILIEYFDFISSGIINHTL